MASSDRPPLTLAASREMAGDAVAIPHSTQPQVEVATQSAHSVKMDCHHIDIDSGRQLVSSVLPTKTPATQPRKAKEGNLGKYPSFGEKGRTFAPHQNVMLTLAQDRKVEATETPYQPLEFYMTAVKPAMFVWDFTRHFAMSGVRLTATLKTYMRNKAIQRLQGLKALSQVAMVKVNPAGRIEVACTLEAQDLTGTSLDIMIDGKLWRERLENTVNAFDQTNFAVHIFAMPHQIPGICRALEARNIQWIKCMVEVSMGIPTGLLVFRVKAQSYEDVEALSGEFMTEEGPMKLKIPNKPGPIKENGRPNTILHFGSTAQTSIEEQPNGNLPSTLHDQAPQARNPSKEVDLPPPATPCSKREEKEVLLPQDSRLKADTPHPKKIEELRIRPNEDSAGSVEEAEKIKKEANRQFAMKDYVEALKYYLMALSWLNQQDQRQHEFQATLLKNAAICFALLRMKSQALWAMDTAIMLDDKDTKAVGRRAEIARTEGAPTAEDRKKTLEVLTSLRKVSTALDGYPWWDKKKKEEVKLPLSSEEAKLGAAAQSDGRKTRVLDASVHCAVAQETQARESPPRPEAGKEEKAPKKKATKKKN